MNIVQIMKKLRFVSKKKLVELYPPFLFMGVKILEISPDSREMHVQLGRRWYFTNMHGSIFGGILCALTDPLAALLCEEIFPGTRVWSKTHTVDFLKPARGRVECRVIITDTDIETINQQLSDKGRALHTFHYMLTDAQGENIAEVKNTVFVRQKKSR